MRLFCPPLLLSGVWLSLTLSAAGHEPSSQGLEPALTWPERMRQRVFRDQLDVAWLADGRTLWYRVQTGPKTQAFVKVDAVTGERQTAADTRSLGLPAAEPVQASATRIEGRRTRRTGIATNLTIRNRLAGEVRLFWINGEGRRTAYGALPAGQQSELATYAGHVWRVERPSGEALAELEAGTLPGTLEIDGAGQPRSAAAGTEQGQSSPDQRWRARVEQGRVRIWERETGQETAPDSGGATAEPVHGDCLWAPDSSAFVVSAAELPPRRRAAFIEAAPDGQLQPQLHQFDYLKPGDALPKPVPVLFRREAGVWRGRRVDSALFGQPFTETPVLACRWSPDSREFYFNYNRRGHQLYRILAVNAQTGAVRVVVEERAETFIDYTRKTWRHWLKGGGELLWMSERDGWCHLWLYDIRTGAVKNRVTQGAWPVREVLHVDEDRREVWFLASGLRAGEDPYHLHLCRANLDGSGFAQLTEADGQHQVTFSPNREFFIDRWSRVDQPPVHELRRSRDGRLVAVLERADASALRAAGWTPPERFAAKGRDGVTDIHGILIKPSNFDPARRYPVVEEIYAGPHSAFVPKEFGLLPRQHQIAELGFIVVQVDGMGTNHRGKVFHDVCWKNLKDAGFPDRIAWMRAAAASRPWMDLQRVGIYGGSAGGQSAMRALLDHHDFYRVAVADCGCHDNRLDKIWWNEQWLGWPVDASYARNSNVEDAGRLEGRLLLIVGELDRNVDPASTTQVVAALQKAGKSFDYMPIQGAGHGAAETPYGTRLRLQFLARHLRP